MIAMVKPCKKQRNKTTRKGKKDRNTQKKEEKTKEKNPLRIKHFVSQNPTRLTDSYKLATCQIHTSLFCNEYQWYAESTSKHLRQPLERRYIRHDNSRFVGDLWTKISDNMFLVTVIGVDCCVIFSWPKRCVMYLKKIFLNTL